MPSPHVSIHRLLGRLLRLQVDQEFREPPCFCHLLPRFYLVCRRCPASRCMASDLAGLITSPLGNSTNQWWTTPSLSRSSRHHGRRSSPYRSSSPNESQRDWCFQWYLSLSARLRRSTRHTRRTATGSGLPVNARVVDNSRPSPFSHAASHLPLS